MKSVIEFGNGLTLQLDLRDGEFCGIGEVLFRGTTLRSPQFPWNFYCESEKSGLGVRFERFRLLEIRETKQKVELILESQGMPMPRVQAIDAMGEARIKPRSGSLPVARWIWSFEPVTERIWDSEWTGVAMQISYDSPDAPIHWLLEQATWEIGGKAEGATLIQQDVSAMDAERVVAPDDAFSTIERFLAEGWGGSYPMDMLPRGAGASICDFQVKGELALVLFSEEPGLTRARFEKVAAESVIHYLDRAYFPLSKTGSAPVRKLLVHVAELPLEKHEIRNLWLDCFTEVRRRIHASYGFELEKPLPSTGGHLWDEDLKRWGGEWLTRLEEEFPEYERLGYRQAYFHAVWDGITTDPNPPEQGNICCPYQFRFSDQLGGVDAIRRTVDTASKHGIRLMQWFSFHLSRFAPIWKEHPDWMLRKACGNGWNGNYSGLVSGRMRSPYRDWVEAQILAVKEDTGLTGIFWDSYQNLGVTGVDWGSSDKAPQADEIFRFQARLQKAGFLQRCEVITIFGVSAVGMFGIGNDIIRRRNWSDFVEGDQAFAMLDTSPGIYAKGGRKKVMEALTPERYFWLAAHRVVPSISANPWSEEDASLRTPGGERAEDYARVNRFYLQSLPRMERLRLQKEGRSVVWLDENGAPAIVWAFTQGELPRVEGSRWVNLDSKTEAVTASPFEVYEAISC